MLSLEVALSRKHLLISDLLVVLACDAKTNAQGREPINAPIRGDLTRVEALPAAKASNGVTTLISFRIFI